jgi:radical SAM superfamily enzyme YgiQ (UPF0313 family)
MKILYVNPGRLESGLDSMIKGVPLNLITIAAMVPEHNAKLFDFKVDKFNEKNFRNELNRQDIVAITSLTPQIYHALEVARLAKEQGCITIMGGYHPTLDPQNVIENLNVDYIIRGEGEHTFKEIVEYLNGNNGQKSIKEIDGVSYKDKSGEIHHNKDRNLECNLDNFPLPRRDLLEGKSYTHMGTKMDNIETSRGCPYNCKFCCIVKMWKDSNQNISYRSKSVSRIMKELYEINRRNDFIFFCEDNFTVNVKRTKHVLDAMIQSGMNNAFNFSAQSRVDTLYRNQWLIDLLKRAGFKQIFLGIESIHQQSLNAMNKRNTTPKMVREVVHLLRSKGISIFGGLIIGFPGETKTMVRQNIQFAKSLNIDFVQFTPITAFPGTEFYEEMKIKNMITSYNYKYYNLFYPMMGTEQLTNVEIYKLVAEAYAYFYLGMGWIKRRAKEYLNPFGRFNWMFKNMVGLIGQGLKEGAGMLMNNGITRKAISNELKQIKIQKNLINSIIYNYQHSLLNIKA